MNIYKIEFEIYEGNGGELRKENGHIVSPDIVKEGICAWMYRGDGERSYREGDRFAFPADTGKLCPWLLASLEPIANILRFGGTLPWQYPDTPYEKEMDADGVTTEFVRCLDPTACGIVVKVIRTKIGEVPDRPPAA